MRALQQQYKWSNEGLDAGGDAYMQGKYRHAVNLFVAAYRQSGGSSGEFSFRYYCVVMVTNALTHAGLDAGERDIKFLKDIMNDEKEEHASRVRRTRRASAEGLTGRRLGAWQAPNAN